MKKRFFAIVPATVLIFGLMGCLSSSSTGDGATASPSSTNTNTNTNSLGGLATLRGKDVGAPENTVHNLGLAPVLETDPVDRNFEDQPPVVSHTVAEYPVTLKSNGCLDCHSRENVKKGKAKVVVPRTHFRAADGKTLSSISGRRHFCLQCHVPQIDAKPLVINTFQTAK